MIEYTVTRQEKKKQFNTLFIKSIAGVMIIQCVCMLFTIYFLVIGYVTDANAKNYGFGLLACIIVIFFILLIRYIALYKNALSNFDAISKDGRIIMQFDNEEFEYIFTNITTGNSIKYRKENLDKIKSYKNMILLYFKGGRVEVLPNTDDIRRVGNFSY